MSSSEQQDADGVDTKRIKVDDSGDAGPDGGAGPDPAPEVTTGVAAAENMEVDVESEDETDDFQQNDDLENGTQETTVYNRTEIVAMVDSLIRETSEILQLPAAKVRVLLNHFKWDKVRLFDHYFVDGEQVCKEAGVIIPEEQDPEMTTEPEGPSECEICMEVFDENWQEIGCGHRFCKPCWTEYLTSKITSDRMSDRITCPSHGCSIVVDSDIVTGLVTDAAVLEDYSVLLTNSFVQTHRLFRWCPIAGCDKAVKLKVSEIAKYYRTTACSCGSEFCFDCENGDHNPVKCRFLVMWLKKNADESETFNWISVNTKECPKCNAPIEKNGGCNHMSCQNPSCKHHFCWICLGDWSKHAMANAYNCNLFTARAEAAAGDSKTSTRAELERYLHYFTRFDNHKKSQALEKKLLELAETKINENVEAKTITWTESQFLFKAVTTLSKCRQVLSNSYIFAFYLENNNEAQIFETNQMDLEVATELLSEYLERDLKLVSLAAIKDKIQKKSRYCARRITIILEHVRESYEKGLWKYRDIATV